MRNTVWDYKKGSNFENILSECESIDHWLSNALSIKFISYLEQKIDIIEKMYIAFLPEPPPKKNIHKFLEAKSSWKQQYLWIFFLGGSGGSGIYPFSMISIFCSRYDMNLIESAIESQWSILSHPEKIFSYFDPYL